MHTLENSYRRKRVLVTGGLGFIGSNLALTLRKLGADVTVIDALVPGCGGNPSNLGDHGSAIRTVIADIADSSLVPDCLDGADVIFNLAAEIAHSASPRDSGRDLSLNVHSQLRFLDHCGQRAKGVRVVFTSTRQVYGPPQYLPVDERHPLAPVDFNGVHKQAAAHYHLLLSRMQMIDGVVLNLTNTYGPRIALNVPGQGFLASYCRRALNGEQLTIFGDGSQLRDPLYVDDAVKAILLAGITPLSEHRVFNIGHPEAWTLREIAGLLSDLAGLPSPCCRPFPDERRMIDIGSYATDTRLAFSVLGWRASTCLPDGLRQTLQFFGWNNQPTILPTGARAAGASDHTP